MPKQKLNLLELAACLMAKPRARSPEIVRSDAEETAFRRCFSYDSPNDLGAKLARRDSSCRVDGTKDWTAVNIRG